MKRFVENEPCPKCGSSFTRVTFEVPLLKVWCGRCGWMDYRATLDSRVGTEDVASTGTRGSFPSEAPK